MKKQNEFQKFDQTMRSLLRVMHGEIQEKLNAEKAAKKRKKSKKSSASGRVGA